MYAVQLATQYADYQCIMHYANNGFKPNKSVKICTFIDNKSENVKRIR